MPVVACRPPAPVGFRDSPVISRIRINRLAALEARGLAAFNAEMARLGLPPVR